jgi:cytochrome c6
MQRGMFLPAKSPTGALRVLVVLCTAAVGACASQAPAAQSPAQGPDAPQLFGRACAKCHSSDGSGGLPMAAGGPRPVNFHDPAWQASRTDAEIAGAIRDGRGAMPPFAGVLTPAEITALAAHVRGLHSQNK